MRWPYSAMTLAACGLILIAMGLYFVLVRPALLPEDIRFLESSLTGIRVALPKLELWLARIFSVMGGQMFAAGLLTPYLAATAFRTRTRGAALIVGLTGLSSIGLMAIVNFAIASDFRWLILSLLFPWSAALGLYWREGFAQQHRL